VAKQKGAKPLPLVDERYVAGKYTKPNTISHFKVHA